MKRKMWRKENEEKKMLVKKEDEKIMKIRVSFFLDSPPNVLMTLSGACFKGRTLFRTQNDYLLSEIRSIRKLRNRNRMKNTPSGQHVTPTDSFPPLLQFPPPPPRSRIHVIYANITLRFEIQNYTEFITDNL